MVDPHEEPTLILSAADFRTLTEDLHPERAEASDTLDEVPNPLRLALAPDPVVLPPPLRGGAAWVDEHAKRMGLSLPRPPRVAPRRSR